MTRILIVSDLHFASEGEKLREQSDRAVATNFLQRAITQTWGHYFWLRHPTAYNHRFAEIMGREPRPDWLIANGDFTVDNAFVGVSDDASFESATLSITQVRAACPGRTLLNIGDHDLGKKSLFGGAGGLRFRSLERMTCSLQVPLVWRQRIGPWVFVGLASTVAALPIFDEEILPEERPEWLRAREQLWSELREIFAGLSGRERVILFVHDPSALPALLELPELSARLPQIAATVIGHLHSPQVLRAARLMSGVPTIDGLGHTTRRYTRALQQARCWRDFKLVLCPSPTGMQFFKDGGYLTLTLPEDVQREPVFERHRLPWV